MSSRNHQSQRRRSKAMAAAAAVATAATTGTTKSGGNTQQRQYRMDEIDFLSSSSSDSSIEPPPKYFLSSRNRTRRSRSSWNRAYHMSRQSFHRRGHPQQQQVTIEQQKGDRRALAMWDDSSSELQVEPPFSLAIVAAHARYKNSPANGSDGDDDDDSDEEEIHRFIGRQKDTATEDSSALTVFRAITTISRDDMWQQQQQQQQHHALQDTIAVQQLPIPPPRFSAVKSSAVQSIVQFLVNGTRRLSSTDSIPDFDFMQRQWIAKRGNNIHERKAQDTFQNESQTNLDEINVPYAEAKEDDDRLVLKWEETLMSRDGSFRNVDKSFDCNIAGLPFEGGKDTTTTTITITTTPTVDSIVVEPPLTSMAESLQVPSGVVLAADAAAATATAICHSSDTDEEVTNKLDAANAHRRRQQHETPSPESILIMLDMLSSLSMPLWQ